MARGHRRWAIELSQERSWNGFLHRPGALKRTDSPRSGLRMVEVVDDSKGVRRTTAGMNVMVALDLRINGWMTELGASLASDISCTSTRAA